MYAFCEFRKRQRRQQLEDLGSDNLCRLRRCGRAFADFLRRAQRHIERSIQFVLPFGGRRLLCPRGDLLEHREEKADVIVANIIADVICFLCGPAKNHLLPGGVFICSGIIREREDDVQRALAQAGYTVCNRLEKGEWVCLAAHL